jgi:hypothetical protein
MFKGVKENLKLKEDNEKLKELNYNLQEKVVKILELSTPPPSIFDGMEIEGHKDLNANII